MELKTFECKISRRGKKARGYITVHTFGKPILNDDGIAKDFSYDHADKISRDVILAELDKLGNGNRYLLKALDIPRKSQTQLAKNFMDILVSRIMATKLVVDKAHAEAFAKAWIDYRKNCLAIGEPAKTYDELFQTWKTKMEKSVKDKDKKPRLVDNREKVETKEDESSIEEEISELESDEEDSEEDSEEEISE